MLVSWRPDSSMIAVATNKGHVIFYNLVVLTEVKTLYEQQDPPNPALRRESAELYFKENVPPLVFSQAFEGKKKSSCKALFPWSSDDRCHGRLFIHTSIGGTQVDILSAV